MRNYDINKGMVISISIIFPDPQFEGLSLDTWTEMLDRVELHDPGQMEIAGLIAGKFAAAAGGGDVAAASAILPSLDPENTQSLDLNSFSPSAGKSDKIYPRTPKEKADYDRQGLAYEGARKLLNGDGLKIIEKPRYLTKRYVSSFFLFCGKSTHSHNIVFLSLEQTA